MVVEERVWLAKDRQQAKDGCGGKQSHCVRTIRYQGRGDVAVHSSSQDGADSVAQWAWFMRGHVCRLREYNASQILNVDQVPFNLDLSGKRSYVSAKIAKDQRNQTFALASDCFFWCLACFCFFFRKAMCPRQMRELRRISVWEHYRFASMAARATNRRCPLSLRAVAKCTKRKTFCTTRKCMCSSMTVLGRRGSFNNERSTGLAFRLRRFHLHVAEFFVNRHADAGTKEMHLLTCRL